MKIPNSWHKQYAYNCLTDEQFKKLQEEIEVYDDFPVDCDECGVYEVGEYHRCSCGNRRCYFTYDKKYGFDVNVD